MLDMNTMPLIKLKNAVGDEAYLTAKIFNSADVDSNEIINATHGENDSVKFNRYDTDFLIDYITKTHHAFAKKNTIIIYNLTQKVAYRHSHEHAELKKFNEVAFFFFQDLFNQVLKEELNLFPHLRYTIRNIKNEGKKDDAALQSLKQKIQLQQAEHEKSFNYLKIFREITNNYQAPPDACWYHMSLFEKMKALEHDLTLHFYLEDNILFRNAIADNEKQVTGIK